MSILGYLWRPPRDPTTDDVSIVSGFTPREMLLALAKEIL
jgi:hypothetical protein